MDGAESDRYLSSSLQAVLATGSTIALVVGVILHQNRHRLPSLLSKQVDKENMRQIIDWEHQTISATVRKNYSSF